MRIKSKQRWYLKDDSITTNVAWSLYLAPSGEPALGPVAFMHRTSAMDIPTAGLTHHWQDATHISFGVVTAGLFTRRVKLEGSFFNGREPDEHRWNFDPIRLDSWSGRLTVNPQAHWSLTAGYSGQPTLANGKLYVLNGSVLAVLNELTGQSVGSWQSPSGTLIGPIIATDNVVFFARKHEQCVFNARPCHDGRSPQRRRGPAFRRGQTW